jgi:hypothetical protein
MWGYNFIKTKHLFHNTHFTLQQHAIKEPIAMNICGRVIDTCNRAFRQITYPIFSFENSIGTVLRKAAGNRKHLWNSSKWEEVVA